MHQDAIFHALVSHSLMNVHIFDSNAFWKIIIDWSGFKMENTYQQQQLG